jgi:hypothetical protein
LKEEAATVEVSDGIARTLSLANMNGVNGVDGKAASTPNF